MANGFQLKNTFGEDADWLGAGWYSSSSELFLDS